MQITRTIQGVELTIDLTEVELYQAWVEQEEEFNRQDMADLIDGESEEDIILHYGVTSDVFNSLVDQMADRYRGYRDLGSDIIYEVEREIREQSAIEVIKEAVSQ